MRSSPVLKMAASVTAVMGAAVFLMWHVGLFGGSAGGGIAASLPAWFTVTCGDDRATTPATESITADPTPTITAGVTGVVPAAGSVASFLTNNGNYMPRIRCMDSGASRPDWPWIIALITVTTGVIAAYIRIMTFWIRAYRAERQEDRNTKLAELAQIFFWCAVCGYGMSIVLFFWPGYRLLVFMLVFLNIWSWRFILYKLSDFRVSMSALRLRRELHESLERRNAELEFAVNEATKELTRARVAAEDASETKSRFLANTSHEIRTPLTSLLGYLDLLETEELDPVLSRQYRATMKRHGGHLLRLINDLLDLSKIEAGEMAIEYHPVDIREVFRDVESVLTTQPACATVRLDIVVEDNVPPAILSDPTRLRQIVLNLASNAVKFAPNGHVRVVASATTNNSGSPTLVITVTDNGIGMSDEQAARLFKPFAQADATVTRRFGGTGLGLTISRSLARAMGGDVTVTSQQGVGSTFTAVIAAEPADPQSLTKDTTGPHTEADPASANTNLDGKILIVDDSEDNRRLFAHLLERAGAEVTTAADGQAACALILEAEHRGEPFSLVLMDLQMQGMDGDEAVVNLRKAGLRTPVVALTANTLDGERARCLAVGFNDFATKPINREELHRVCRRWLAATDQRSAA